MKMRATILAAAGFLGWTAGVEGSGFVPASIYLLQQGTACRVEVDKSVWVSLSDDGLQWLIENQGCELPAYLEIKSDISIGRPLPDECLGTFKITDANTALPPCIFPHESSYDGTYGFQAYVNCQPGVVCPPGDPEVVVEREQPFVRQLDTRVPPSRQRLAVPVTLRKVDGRCEAQLALSVPVDKEVKGIEWSFYNECDKGPHYVDLRRVVPSRAKPMLSRVCNQSGAIRESPMRLRCHLENPLDTAGILEYWVAVDCIGKANCAQTKATLTRRH